MADQNPDNRLYNRPDIRQIRAYNDMMHAIHDVFDMADAETTDISLQQALTRASSRLLEAGEITPAEAARICSFIKRDINDAAEYLMESSAEFSDWLQLDIEIVERKIVDLFLSVADSTRIEIEQIRQSNSQHVRFHTGEVTGPGTLECVECSKHIAYPATSVIFRCPECSHDVFKRPQVKRLSD